MGGGHETYWSFCPVPPMLLWGEKAMAITEAATKLVQIDGENAVVVERLREPLSRALGNRRGFYRVRVETVGRVGEVLVSILGYKGRIPLLFAPDELEPGYVHGIVRDTVDRFGF
jgi:hypothetical protein